MLPSWTPKDEWQDQHHRVAYWERDTAAISCPERPLGMCPWPLSIPSPCQGPTEVKGGWKDESLIWVATPGRGHQQSWSRRVRRAQGMREQGVGSWLEKPSWGGGECVNQAPSPGHMLHCPISLHSQDVNLQIKFLWISRLESQALYSNSETFLNMCDHSGNRSMKMAWEQTSKGKQSQELDLLAPDRTVRDRVEEWITGVLSTGWPTSLQHF